MYPSLKFLFVTTSLVKIRNYLLVALGIMVAGTKVNVCRASPFYLFGLPLVYACSST